MSVPLSIDIKTTGGAQAKSQLDQVGRSMQTVGQQAQKTGGFMDRLASTFTAKRAMIFSLSGIVASGVEAIGMFSLLGDSQKKVADITAELTQMQKEGKTGTKEYADASRELEGAQRALRFQLRLTVLSAFDLLPFTINFISSMVRMKAESLANAASNKVLAQSNQQLAATELEVAGAQTTHAASQRLVATSAAPLTAALAAQRVQLAAGVAPLTLLNTNLTKVPVAMGAATTSTNIFSRALQSMWLRVLGPVGLAIGALLIAVEAWKGNWMGFGDAVNAAGVQIGNIHPILKTTMELIAKVGESIHALLTFDLDKLGEIWGGGGLAPPVKTNKALEEAQKNLLEFQKTSADMFSEIAAGNRGEQRDFLKLLGVTGNEKKDIKQALDAVEEIDKAIQSFHTGLQTMEQLDLLESLGLSDVKVDEIFDDIMSNVADNFRDAGKDLELEGPAKDMFETFADELDKASEMGKDKGLKAIMAWIDKNPDFLPFLQKHAPQLAKDIEAMIGTAGSQVDISDIPAGDLVRNKLEEANRNTKLINEGKNFGARLLQGLEQAFTPASANKLGLAIRKGLIDPLITSATGALNWGAGIAATIVEGIAKFDWVAGIANLNAAIGAGGDIIGNFIAGIFGFTSNVEMKSEIDNFFINTLPMIFRVGWTNFTESLKTVFSVGNIAGAIFNVGGFINTVLGGLFGTVGTLLPQIINWLNINIFDPITTQFDLIMQEIGTEVLSIASVIDSAIDWIGTALTSILGTATDILTSAGQWFLDNIVTPIKAAWDLVISTITGIFSGAVELFTGGGGGKDGEQGKPLLDRIFEAIFGTAEASEVEGEQKVIPAIISVSATTVSADITLSNLEVRIAALSKIFPSINLNPAFAGQTLTAIANTILGLQNLQPQISLQDSEAGATLTGVMNTILGLENLEPQISLQNQEALNTIADTGQRIMDLEDLEPTIHVHVEAHKHFSEGDLTSGYSMASGGVLSAARGKIHEVHGERQITVGDNVGGQESIAFIPHNDPYPIINRILEKFGYNKGVGFGSGGHAGFGGMGGGPEVNLVIFMDGQRMRNEVVKGIIKNQAGYR